MKKLEIEHKKEVKKLNKLEKELIEIISNINNELLLDKFIEWQKQKNMCNFTYNKWLAEELKRLNQ